MPEHAERSKINGWYLNSGPEGDVVVSSRVRLSRNVSSFPFPGSMDEEEDAGLKKKVAEAFSRLKESRRFALRELTGMSPVERRILLEKNIISRESCDTGNSVVFLRDDEAVSCTVNETDHLRLATIRAGLDLEKGYKDLEELEEQLEEDLDFAVSLDLGYLNTDITNVGTGMKASVMLHLPALVATSLIEKAVGVVNQLGLSVKGFSGEGEHSLGNMYQIANQVTLGVSEKDILEKLEGIALQLVNYERKAREEMMSQRRIDVEDSVWRAYGILKHAKVISSREAIELLSALRMGIALEMIHDVSLEAVTSLLFVTQQAHIEGLSGISTEEAEDEMIEYARAGLIHEFLERTTLRGGTDNV